MSGYEIEKGKYNLNLVSRLPPQDFKFCLFTL